jgi:hypothetical protein
MEWLPIESAPKDGTPVRLKGELFSEVGAHEVVGWWTGDFSDQSGCGYSGWTTGDRIDWGDPDETGNHADGPDEVFPTHWMPLPTPPTA